MSAASEEGMGWVERGRLRYQNKDYTGALKAFSEAVAQSTGNLQLVALDHRAATYEKLADLKNALRDSKNMIDMMPEGSKGYLRCAKVLQLKGEKELALKIYERGLTKVKIGLDKDRTTLQAMYNKLRQAQNPGQSRDPLQFLPLELAEMVIRNLAIRDRVICLAVSKSWKRLLDSSHKLWTTLDTSHTRRPISQNSLKVHLRRSNYTLENAIIHSRAHFDAIRMSYVTKTCKKLKYLELTGTGVIGDSLTAALPVAHSLTSLVVSANYEISRTSVLSALNICKNTLTEARFLRIKGNMMDFGNLKLEHLKTLHMKTHDEGSMDTDGLFLAIPNINSLELVGWRVRQLSPTTLQPRELDFSILTKLEHINLTDLGLLIMPTFHSNIKTLRVSRNSHLCLGNPSLPPEVQAQLADEAVQFCFPLLEIFDCEGTAISTEFVKRIIMLSAKAGNLKELLLGFRFVDVKDEYPVSETVYRLSLRGLNIAEQSIIDAVDKYPNVKTLDVGMTRVTGVAVKQFVETGVRHLILDECAHISPDAIDYARGKGVHVEYNFPSRTKLTSFRESAGRAY